MFLLNPQLLSLLPAIISSVTVYHYQRYQLSLSLLPAIISSVTGYYYRRYLPLSSLSTALFLPVFQRTAAQMVSDILSKKARIGETKPVAYFLNAQICCT